MKRLIQVILAVINLSGDDGSKNMFVYQSKTDMLELKKDKGTDYVLSWKSKRTYTFKINLLHAAFLHSINFSVYRIGIKLIKTL